MKLLGKIRNSPAVPGDVNSERVFIIEYQGGAYAVLEPRSDAVANKLQIAKAKDKPAAVSGQYKRTGDGYSYFEVKQVTV